MRSTSAAFPSGLPGRGLLWGLLVCCAGLAATACAPPRPPRGLVLLVVDTLRADHLGAYGYARPTSPALDAFAAHATLFGNAVSQAPWTLPSVATLMTSLYPGVHGAGVRSNLADLDWLVAPDRFHPTSRLEASRTTLAEILRQNGFATAAFVQGAYPSRPFGFAQGFDTFSDNQSPGIRFDVESALAWIDAHPSDRFFVYLHSVEVHAPYAPREYNDVIASRWPAERRDEYRRGLEEERRRMLSFDFDPSYRGSVDGSLETLASLARRGSPLPRADREHLLALYDRGIAYTDYWFGRLLEGLERRGLAGETLVVFTSDHGEEFQEHGGFRHSRTYYEEMLHVPLVVRVPGRGEGRRVNEQVGLVDVLPTVLDALGVRFDGLVEGRSLMPLLRGGSLPERSLVAEASVVQGTRAVRTSRWKYIQLRDQKAELYDLRKDPHERSEECGSELPTCLKLREELGARQEEERVAAAAIGSGAGGEAALDAVTRAQLQALGYATDGQAGAPAPAPPR